MELTAEEQAKACKIASQEVLARSDKYKPEHATAIRNEKGWVCEQTFLGSTDDELACSIKIQWNYMAGGCVNRICQYVHARLSILRNDQGRFLRLAGLHVAQWDRRITNQSVCKLCPEEYQREPHVIVQDTSLHEY